MLRHFKFVLLRAKLGVMQPPILARNKKVLLRAKIGGTMTPNLARNKTVLLRAKLGVMVPPILARNKTVLAYNRRILGVCNQYMQVVGALFSSNIKSRNVRQIRFINSSVALCIYRCLESTCLQGEKQIQALAGLINNPT